jgi:hypothetical protein
MTEMGEQHLNAATEGMSGELGNEAFYDFNINEYASYDYDGEQYMQSNGDEIEECTNVGHHEKNKNMILLDSQSTHSTFCTKKMLTNIRPASKELHMFSNGGDVVYKKQGDLKNYGTVWYNPCAIANIISMSEAEKKGHTIRYTKGCLTLTNPLSGRVTPFHVTTEGLYAYKAPDTGTSMTQTVSENAKFYTPRQIDRAKIARDLYGMIGRPSKNDFFGIVRNNMLLNSPVTEQDIMVAENIFGDDIGSIQGKTTRSRPDAVCTDYVNVPEDLMRTNKKITISVDVMMVDTIMFLGTTSQKLNTTSSTEAELVAADDIIPQMLWTRQFLLAQGVEISHNVLHQDNKGAILLEENGIASSSLRTRHINIRYFFIKDRVTANELELQYCPTDQMIGDFFTKPLQGKKFFFFRKIIMGEKNE